MDLVADNYNILANTDDSSCYYIGCTDSAALNYDSTATVNNGCIYPVLGCTDPDAYNYNPLANVDDSTCLPVILGCMDVTMWNYNSLANTDNGNCIPFMYGCTDSTSFNFDPLANTDNNTCVEFIYGCTDVLSFNYNPLANTLDNSCCYIGGCTDATALNYDEDACFNDGSCIDVVEGCTDVSAFNYNAAANVSDSISCLYEAVGCVTGLGAPNGTGYWLNDGCFAWVIDVDNYCCTNEWDASCQTLYNYCQEGWPVSVNELEGTTIVVYPNPSSGIFNIDTRLDVDVEVWDMSGRKLINTKETRIDLREYDAGVYNMIIIYNNIRFNKRVIKQ